MMSAQSLVRNLRNDSQPEEAAQVVYVYEQAEAKDEHIADYNRPNNQVEVHMDEFEIEHEFEQQQNFEFGYQQS